MIEEMTEQPLPPGMWRCGKCRGINEPTHSVCPCNDKEDTVPETFEEAIDSIFAELRQVLLSKRRDYGSDNIGAFGELGVLVRVYDKVARLKNLLYDNPGEPKNEALEDTWRDISNYGLLALMERRGILKLPLEEKR